MRYAQYDVIIDPKKNQLMISVILPASERDILKVKINFRKFALRKHLKKINFKNEIKKYKK